MAVETENIFFDLGLSKKSSKTLFQTNRGAAGTSGALTHQKTRFLTVLGYRVGPPSWYYFTHCPSTFDSIIWKTIDEPSLYIGHHYDSHEIVHSTPILWVGQYEVGQTFRLDYPYRRFSLCIESLTSEDNMFGSVFLIAVAASVCILNLPKLPCPLRNWVKKKLTSPCLLSHQRLTTGIRRVVHEALSWFWFTHLVNVISFFLSSKIHKFKIIKTRSGKN